MFSQIILMSTYAKRAGFSKFNTGAPSWSRSTKLYQAMKQEWFRSPGIRGHQATDALCARSCWTLVRPPTPVLWGYWHHLPPSFREVFGWSSVKEVTRLRKKGEGGAVAKPCDFFCTSSSVKNFSLYVQKMKCNASRLWKVGTHDRRHVHTIKFKIPAMASWKRIFFIQRQNGPRLLRRLK